MVQYARTPKTRCNQRREANHTVQFSLYETFREAAREEKSTMFTRGGRWEWGMGKKSTGVMLCPKTG